MAGELQTILKARIAAQEAASANKSTLGYGAIEADVDKNVISALDRLEAQVDALKENAKAVFQTTETAREKAEADKRELVGCIKAMQIAFRGVTHVGNLDINALIAKHGAAK